MKKISLIQTLVGKLVFSLGISFVLRNKLQTYAFCCFAFTNRIRMAKKRENRHINFYGDPYSFKNKFYMDENVKY